MHYIQIKDNKIIGKGQCKILNSDILNVEVSEDIYNNIEKYIYKDNELVLNPDYEKELAKKREEKFNKLFFNTSLGYIKRQVTMKDGTIKSFLTDIVPLLQVGIPIISYDKPDFTTEDMPKQNTDKIVTDEFINECKQQVLKDFYGANEI